MTNPNSNAGIYFHTKYQEIGWPKYGFEVQVNNTYKDPKKTGSLYGVQDNLKAPVEDNKWFTMHIIVNGRTVKTFVDGKQIVNWTQEDGRKAGAKFTRVLDQGTFAIQAHDAKSIVKFRKISVKRLP